MKIVHQHKEEDTEVKDTKQKAKRGPTFEFIPSLTQFLSLIIYRPAGTRLKKGVRETCKCLDLKHKIMIVFHWNLK